MKLLDQVREILLKGGKGSGNFHRTHRGRPGLRGGSTSSDSISDAAIDHPETMRVPRNDPKGLTRASEWASKISRQLFDKGYKNIRTNTVVDGNDLVYSVSYDDPQAQASAPAPAPPKPIAPKPVEPKPAPTPVDVPAPKPKSVVGKAFAFVGKKASQLLDIPNARVASKKAMVEEMNNTLKAMDKIHRFPGSHRMIFKWTASQVKLGCFKLYGTMNGIIKDKPAEIFMRPGEENAGLTLAHELGHALDYLLGDQMRIQFGLPSSSNYFTDYTERWRSAGKAMENDPNWETKKKMLDSWNNVRDALKKTENLKLLNNMLHDPYNHKIKPLGMGNNVTNEFDALPDKKYVRYLLSEHEIFARAYSQYVATKTKLPSLLASVKFDRERPHPAQWTDEDFAPVAEALDDFFKVVGVAA